MNLLARGSVGQHPGITQNGAGGIVAAALNCQDMNVSFFHKPVSPLPAIFRYLYKGSNAA